MSRLERRQRALVIDSIIQIADTFELPLENDVIVRAIAGADVEQLEALLVIVERLKQLKPATLH